MFYLNEFVADNFLFSPVFPDLVDEDDVVGLADGQLGAVRRKLDGLKIRMVKTCLKFELQNYMNAIVS